MIATEAHKGQTDKVGNANVNNWLRACRNIVRFRDAALHPDIITKRRLELIVSRILTILEGQIQESNYKRIFDNCILTCLYLLKRRRYDNAFLNSENHEAFMLDNVLNKLLTQQNENLSAKQHSIINATLKFLRKKASLKDLDSSVLTG
jgi:hypothetical protein